MRNYKMLQFQFVFLLSQKICYTLYTLWLLDFLKPALGKLSDFSLYFLFKTFFEKGEKEMKESSLVWEPLAPHRGGGCNDVNHNFCIANKLALFPIPQLHPEDLHVQEPLCYTYFMTTAIDIILSKNVIALFIT